MMNPELENNQTIQNSEASLAPGSGAQQQANTSVNSSNQISAVETLVPYKNKNALIGYYLGVASIVPFLGAIFFIPAYAFSIIGLIAVNKNPLIRGKVHAIVGITLASLQLVGLIGFAVFVVIVDKSSPY